MNGMSWECRIIGIFFYINCSNKLLNPSSVARVILWRVQRVLCSFVCSRKGKAEEKGRRMGEKQQAPLAIVILMFLMLSSYYGI